MRSPESFSQEPVEEPAQLEFKEIVQSTPEEPSKAVQKPTKTKKPVKPAAASGKHAFMSGAAAMEEWERQKDEEDDRRRSQVA